MGVIAILGHSLYESVNWNSQYCLSQLCSISHSLYESVNWNKQNEIAAGGQGQVTLFTRVWIEIFKTQFVKISIFGHSLYESVNWNTCPMETTHWVRQSLSLRECELKFRICEICFLYRNVTLFTRVWIEIQIVKNVPARVTCHSLYESVNWNICHPM